MVLVAGACSASGHLTIPLPSTTAGSTTTSTVPVTKSGETRTVLSPIGLNVRAQPEKTAHLLGTAAQGTALAVIGYTSDAGGWYQVKGSTVTGWITADPTLSAAGEFRPYGSGVFNALLPATWEARTESPASVLFGDPSGGDNVMAITAPNVTSLPNVPVGYGERSSQQILVCGVTSRLVTFSRVGGAPASSVPSPTTVPTGVPQPYLVVVRLPMDAQHAVGFYANLSNLHASLDSFKALVYSVTFPFPVCAGG